MIVNRKIITKTPYFFLQDAPKRKNLKESPVELIMLKEDVFCTSYSSVGAIYNTNYYENGLKSGLSCYKDYSWRPDLTLPICSKYIDFLNLKKGDRVLDYGCAKGFMVKGLRSFGIDARGFDISRYAISKAPSDVKPYLSNEFKYREPFDWIISKDVLEHVSKGNLKNILGQIKDNSRNSFIIIPLAKNGKYIVPDNELDATHIIREPIEWWLDQFKDADFKIKDTRFDLPPIKEHHTSKYPQGTAFIVLES